MTCLNQGDCYFSYKQRASKWEWSKVDNQPRVQGSLRYFVFLFSCHHKVVRRHLGYTLHTVLDVRWVSLLIPLIILWESIRCVLHFLFSVLNVFLQVRSALFRYALLTYILGDGGPTCLTWCLAHSSPNNNSIYFLIFEPK